MPAFRFPTSGRLLSAILVSLSLHLVILDMAAFGGSGQPPARPRVMVVARLLAAQQAGTPETAPAPRASDFLQSSPRHGLQEEDAPVLGATGTVGAETTGLSADLASDAEEDGRDPMAEDSFFYPARALNRSPVPISAPNPRRYLSGIDAPSGVFRVRLFIDATGNVVRVDGDPAGTGDAPIYPALEQMFRATTFIPGNLAGQDVASYVDIVLEMADL